MWPFCQRTGWMGSWPGAGGFARGGRVPSVTVLRGGPPLPADGRKTPSPRECMASRAHAEIQSRSPGSTATMRTPRSRSQAHAAPAWVSRSLRKGSLASARRGRRARMRSLNLVTMSADAMAARARSRGVGVGGRARAARRGRRARPPTCAWPARAAQTRQWSRVRKMRRCQSWGLFCLWSGACAGHAPINSRSSLKQDPGSARHASADEPAAPTTATVRCSAAADAATPTAAAQAEAEAAAQPPAPLEVLSARSERCVRRTPRLWRQLLPRLPSRRRPCCTPSPRVSKLRLQNQGLGRALW